MALDSFHFPDDPFVIISILDLRSWKPLTRTKKFDALFHNITLVEEVQIRKAFGVFLGRLLVDRARQAIHSQKFPVRYKRLSPQYVKWKKANKRKRGYWRSSEFLVDHIKTWFDRKNDIVRVGFPARLKHPDNGQLLNVIARSLELGVKERNLPARPLFIPIARSIEKSIGRLFLKFMLTQEKQYHKFLPKRVD